MENIKKLQTKTTLSDLEIMLKLDTANKNLTADDFKDGEVLAQNEHSGNRTDASYDKTSTEPEETKTYTQEEINVASNNRLYAIRKVA